MPSLDDITDDLDFIDDWEERYKYVIELGRDLEPLNDNERSEETRVRGCASQVWLVPAIEGEGAEAILRYRGDSDALIVKGLIAIVLALFSGKTATSILDTDALAYFDKIGLREHLSQQRSNGLVSMVERIRRDADALSRQV